MVVVCTLGIGKWNCVSCTPLFLPILPPPPETSGRPTSPPHHRTYSRPWRVRAAPLEGVVCAETRPFLGTWIHQFQPREGGLMSLFLLKQKKFYCIWYLFQMMEAISDHFDEKDNKKGGTLIMWGSDYVVVYSIMWAFLPYFAKFSASAYYMVQVPANLFCIRTILFNLLKFWPPGAFQARPSTTPPTVPSLPTSTKLAKSSGQASWAILSR